MSEQAEFGLTLLVVGMGGTLASLFVITLAIKALVAVLPVKRANGGNGR